MTENLKINNFYAETLPITVPDTKCTKNVQKTLRRPKWKDAAHFPLTTPLRKLYASPNPKCNVPAAECRASYPAPLYLINRRIGKTELSAQANRAMTSACTRTSNAMAKRAPDA